MLSSLKQNKLMSSSFLQKGLQNELKLVSRKLQIGKKLRSLPLQIGKKMICLPPSAWPTFSTRQASLIFYLRFICLMTAIPFAIFYLAHRLLRLGQFLRPKRVRPQVSRRPSKILPRYGIFRIRIKKRTLPRFPPSLFIYVIILCSITYLNIFITRALPPLTTHTRTLLFSM